ncbi:hypothetical protein HDV00_000141 [Rhizophlyctis rosea]|nr:hypothetical protein HDV00_000141 [Rhizophlyctis rosea]
MEQMRNKYEQLLADRNELRTRLQDMEQSVSQLSEAGKIDFILRTEIDNLKADLNKSENKRLESEAVVEKQNQIIADLTKRVEETSKKAEEASRLKDQLDEFRHTADKLQKSEAMIDKYKKKLEEVGDLRKQMKAVEKQHQLQTERNAQLEEEYRKVSSFKPLMDTYKEQIGELEKSNSTLQVENSSLDFQLKDARTKLERYESERKADQETIVQLEDRIKDMELQGAGIEMHGAMSDELDDASNGALRTKIAQLERELDRFKAAKLSDQSDTTRVAVLESLLEDATRLKEKFEQDYRQAFEKNLALENEMKQLQSVSSAEGADIPSGLRSKLADYESHISLLQSQLAERDQMIASGRSASPSGATNDVTHAGIPSSAEKHKRQIRQLTDENRQAMAQVNKLLHEKEKLQSEYAESKELLHQQERITSDLRSALAAMESRGQSSDETTQKLGSVTQKMVQSQEQNIQLHEALKRAKEHIILQEKQLKERQAALPKDGNYAEAIASFETQLKERDEEIQRIRRELSDTRAAAKREQRLMLSAWNNVGTELQKQNFTQQRSGTSASWLAQQRKALSPQITKRR